MEDIEEIKNLINALSKKIEIKDNKNPYQMFSIDEAAIAFNLSKQRITAALNKKEMPEYKLDMKQRMIKRRDMEKWIDSKQKIDVPLFRSKNF